MKRMPLFIAAAVSFSLFGATPQDFSGNFPRTITTETGFQLRVDNVVTGLDTPWDLAWGPNGELWFTERNGSVSRIDLRSNERITVGTVPEVLESGEGGLMGMAFHPDFPRQPWIYFAHTYSSESARGNRLVRMRYSNGQLSDLEVLLAGLRGAGNHNGSRIVFGPDRFLYMTMGEAGQRQLSQDKSSLNGKILRLTLEGKPAPGNPFGDAIWSWGHRNPQGLFFQPGTNNLYSSEHGGNAEDEVNRIEKGGNYGWPTVEGMCNTPSEREFCTANNTIDPLFVIAPTEGMSASDFYNSDAIPGWKGNILVVTLRGQSLIRIVLSADGRTSTSSERLYRGEFGRIRDVLTGPDGSVYLATSNQDGRGGQSMKPGDDKIIRLRR